MVLRREFGLKWKYQEARKKNCIMRSFTIYTDDHIKENEMGGARSILQGDTKHVQKFQLETLM
jgi:hypothetical protein